MNWVRILLFTIFTLGFSFILANIFFDKENIGPAMFVIGIAISAGYIYGSFQMISVFKKQMQDLINEYLKNMK